MRSAAQSRLPLALSLAFPVLCLGTITFERTWHWQGNSYGRTAQQTSDGGFIVGASVSTPHPPGSAALIRTDSLGDTLWVAVFPRWRGGYVGIAPDGGFIVVGDTFDNDWGHIVVAAKVDTAGATLWRRKLFAAASILVQAAASTRDGGVVVTGVFDDVLGSHLGMVKVDSSGELAWDRTYVLPGEETGWGNAVIQTQDGGFVVCGSWEDTSHVFYLCLVRTDSGGETLWTRTLNLWGRFDISEGKGLAETEDGGYIVVGEGRDTTQQARGTLLLKTDHLGEIQWINVHAGDSISSQCVNQTRDKGFIIAGRGYSLAARLTRTDSIGVRLWSRGFIPRFAAYASARWVEQTADGGFVLAGDVDYYYVYLVKTDSLGVVEVGLAESAGPDVDVRVLELSPNPCAGRLTIWLRMDNGEQARVGIFDIAGRRLRTMVGERSLKAAVSMTWDGTDDTGRLVPAGVYLVRLEVEGKTLTRKLVVQR